MGGGLLNQVEACAAGARGKPVREWSWFQLQFICSPHRSPDNSCLPVTTETTVARQQQASISVRAREKHHSVRLRARCYTQKAGIPIASFGERRISHMHLRHTARENAGTWWWRRRRQRVGKHSPCCRNGLLGFVSRCRRRGIN